MNRTVYMSAAAIVALAANANAGILFSSTVGDTSNLLSEFATNHNGGNSNHLGLNNIAGITGGTQLNFGSLPNATPYPGPNGNFDVDITSNDAGSFFLGDSASLNNTYFSAGDTPRPADGTHTLAWGNTTYTSNSVTLTFVPDTVNAFGFNYEDIGDVGATLTVEFANGAGPVTLVIGVGGDADGFVSIVSDTGDTIKSITMYQEASPDHNDGFSFYGFTTVQVVPVPTAALAGLGLLIPLGVARRIKRRRA